MRCKRLNHRVSGFTLIELVVGMLVLSIALVMMTSMLFPQADRAAQTLQRVRSAELAHSVMNEIWGKRYDQNTNPNGGTPACGITGLIACSEPNELGPDKINANDEGRNDFNDVDDYNGLNITSPMFNSSDTYLDHYPHFGLKVTVEYVDATTRAAKLISVIVTTPSGEEITYQSVRSNY